MATILIAGASRGIGLELTRQALARGDRALAAVRAPGRAAETAALLTGADGMLLPLDVADPASCEALADRLAAETIDMLVCMAGVLEGDGPMSDPAYTADNWARTLTTNVAGPFFTARALAGRMRAPGGRIAVISSSMALRPKGNSYPYRVSKAAATALARNLAAELAPQGIAAIPLDPGWVRTDMGGQEADISVEDSAAGILKVLDGLTMADTGRFLRYDGFCYDD